MDFHSCKNSVFVPPLLQKKENCEIILTLIIRKTIIFRQSFFLLLLNQHTLRWSIFSKKFVLVYHFLLAKFIFRNVRPKIAYTKYSEKQKFYLTLQSSKSLIILYILDYNILREYYFKVHFLKILVALFIA